MKSHLDKILKHPLGALYGTLLGLIAFFAVLPMFAAGAWDAVLVDIAMAAILIWLMLKSFVSTGSHQSNLMEKCSAWAILILANVFALLPTHNLSGSLSTAFALTLLICAFVLYFSGTYIAAVSIAPALWCCVFIPYHEEIMLLLSFPLRLSASFLSSVILKLFGTELIASGTSLILSESGINIAITDACSGIKQMDAFILIAFIAVQILHTKTGWKLLHFAFIIPAVIVGNSLRIVLTIVLCRMLGEVVLYNPWHTVLGYVQIVFALLIFLAIGKLFSAADKKSVEEES